jgi:fucose permease
MSENIRAKRNVRSTAIVYGAAFMLGITMVSFPASSTVLKTAGGLTDSQYGLIFLPQLMTAVLGAVAGGILARRTGLGNLLFIALIANALSQVCLGSLILLKPGTAFFAVMAATTLFGLAFGLSAAPLNTFPGLLFPRKPESALVALHTLIGLGLSAGPLIAGQLIARGRWPFFPLLLFVGSLLLVVGVACARLPLYGAAASRPETPGSLRELRLNPVLWTFAAIVVLYAFAEGTFSNWSVIYLHEERGIGIAEAGMALSVFWAMVAAGRLLVSALLLRVAAERIWLALPILMAGGFFLVPLAHTAAEGIVVFGFAGLACSAFFPLSVGMAVKRFSGNPAFVSSLMIAAVMSGVGIGSYIIGPLRSSISLERLYRLSALYPAAIIVVAALAIRMNLMRPKGSAGAVSEPGRTDRV